MVQGLARQPRFCAGLMRSLLNLASVQTLNSGQTKVFAWVLSLAAGLAQAVSMGTPWDGQPLWWLQVISLGALAWQLNRLADWRVAAIHGLLFATAWLTGTFWWLFISMHTFGGLPAWLSAVAVFALAGILALYYALACGIYVAIAPRSKAWGAVLFAEFWLLAELARGQWFTGFGWGGAGYAHADGALAGYAPWLGVYGMSAIAAWLAISLSRLRGSSHWQRAAVFLVAVLPVLSQWSGAEWSSPAGRLQVTLLQGNIPQNEKFQQGSGVPQALNWYAEQLGKNNSSLVVAPETALPLLQQQLPEGYWDALVKRYASGDQAALIGLPLGSYTAGYTNSVVGLKPAQSTVWQYDKHHLVPFGEFIPPFFKWFTELMNIPLGDFNRGGLGQASFEWQGQRLAANICYEDLFGEELGARFIQPDAAPTIFVNVSNIAWFGNTVAIDQHLQISRLRALEFSRPFVGATNTGATVIIDHQGRVTAQLPRYIQGVLTGEVQGRSGVTPYAWWVSRFGLWPLWLIAFGVLLLAWRQHRKISGC